MPNKRSINLLTESENELNDDKNQNNVNTNEKKLREELDKEKSETKRLTQLLEKYRKESISITNKSIEWRDKERSAVKQLLELFKFNHYLLQHIPDSEAVVNEYLNESKTENNDNNDNQLNGYHEIENNETEVDNNDESDVETRTNGHSVSYMASPRRSPRRSPIKRANQRPQRRSPRKRQPSESNQVSSHESNAEKEVNNDKYKRRSRKNTNKQNDGSDDETESPAKRSRSGSQSTASTSGTNSRKGTRSASNNSNKSNNSTEVTSEAKSKTQVKRRRRTAQPQHTGFFPCSFDEKQCNLILKSKEEYHFHMSGHLDAKYVCPFCPYTGPTLQVIKRHVTTEKEQTKDEDSKKIHSKYRLYKCNGCKVCNKVHERDEERCIHIGDDNDNDCQWSHDIDHEFKDHIKTIHFKTLFNNIKDEELRRKKIKDIVNKFVDEQYFENNAKKRIMVEKYSNRDKDREYESSDSE